MQNQSILSRMLARELRSRGYVVSLISTNAVRWKRIAAFPVDLLLIDAGLPYDRLLQTARKFRAKLRQDSMPVLALTNTPPLLPESPRTGGEEIELVVKADWQLNDVLKRVQHKAAVGG